MSSSLYIKGRMRLAQGLPNQRGAATGHDSRCRAVRRSENFALERHDPRSVESRTSQHRCALGSGLDLILLKPHHVAGASARDCEAAHTLMCLSKEAPCWRRLLLFLAGLLCLLRLLRFLSHGALRSQSWFNASRIRQAFVQSTPQFQN
jgi:hypothetical protein